MQFKSDERRRGILALALTFVLDAVLSMIVAKFAGPPGQFWANVLIIFVLIEAASFALLLKNAIWGAIIWYFLGKTRIEDRLYRHFRSKGFPPPDEYEDSPGAYFGRLRNDPDLDLETRLNAAAEHGAFDAMCGGGIMKGVTLSMAYEAAIKKLAH